MTELPYMPEHVHDIMAETSSLTDEELGTFMRLRWALWRAGGYLRKHEVESIARGKLTPSIILRMTKAGHVFSSETILAMLLRTRERRAKATARAAKAAAARWNNGEIVATSATSSNYNALADARSTAQACQSKSKYKNLSYSDVYESGGRLLVERVGLRNLAARSQIAKWIAAAGNDNEVSSILAAVDREGLRGPQMVAVVDQRIALIGRIRERGLPLPFGPNLIKSRL